MDYIEKVKRLEKLVELVGLELERVRKGTMELVGICEGKKKMKKNDILVKARNLLQDVERSKYLVDLYRYYG